jgi:hypothetical protein
MSEHTKGPWIEFTIQGRTKVILPAGQPGTICSISEPLSDAEANAVGRLIAAAPDLLAALRAVLADIRDYERANNLAPNPGKQDCWQSVTNARAVIAKATRKN